MRFVKPAIAAVALLAAQVGPGLAQTTPQATAPATMPPASVAPAAPPPAAATPGASIPETTAPAPQTAAPQTTAPQTTAPLHKPHKPHAHGKRMSMHQRFATANTAQDGHLTLDEARNAKWSYAVRNFSIIDSGHKGYITEADIHAFAHARYLARHAATAAPTPGPVAPPAPSAAPPAQ